MGDQGLSYKTGRKNKRRRRGYRGFGSPLREERGTIHWGRGFSGIGLLGENGGLLPHEIGLIPQDSTSKPQ